jgi:GntR family transcriptional regulator
MPVILTVDARSGVPIYQQIVEQVKRSTALGVLLPGEQLPTVKQLALNLTINPNTVARAYRDLERDGVIETSPGRGSFVRGDGTAESSAKVAAVDVARKAIEDAVREAKAMGLSRAEVDKVVGSVLDRWFAEGK